MTHPARRDRDFATQPTHLAIFDIRVSMMYFAKWRRELQYRSRGSASSARDGSADMGCVVEFARLTFYAETAGTMSYRLLEADEPPPVLEYRRGGRSPFVIADDHAGRRIPRRLRNLGLPLSELERHTAWDLEALAVAMSVSPLPSTLP